MPDTAQAKCLSASKSKVRKSKEWRGEHWRVKLPQGVVHLWRPKNYRAKDAGVVVYVHGHRTSADVAWCDNRLPQKFAASGRNALFVVAEAQRSAEDEIPFPNLKVLLKQATDAANIPLPSSPIVALTHSGGYRNVEAWLGHPRLQFIIFLDAFYGFEDEFWSWLQKKNSQIVIVALSTLRWAEPFVNERSFASILRRRKIPNTSAKITSKERSVKLLYMKSQFSHMGLVNSPRVIPTLLSAVGILSSTRKK